MATHQYFIKKLKMPQQHEEHRGKIKHWRQKGPQAKRGAGTGLQMLFANEDSSDNNKDNEYDPPSSHVLFDIEAQQDMQLHVANLVVAATEHDNRPLHFLGEHCIWDFLK